MQFHLVYRGQLKTSGNSARHVPQKHAIRRAVHRQLRHLWDNAAVLREIKTASYTDEVPWEQEPPKGYTKLDYLADKFKRCGYRFAPLVTRDLLLACKLDILFLRRDTPALSLIQRGGDIDGRIKTLFDALRMPGDCSEIPQGAPRDADDDPFFCLLEDDSLITDVSIATGTLLTPKQEGEAENDVELIIGVTIKPIRLHAKNIHFS